MQHWIANERMGCKIFYEFFELSANLRTGNIKAAYIIDSKIELCLHICFSLMLQCKMKNVSVSQKQYRPK